MSSSAYRRRGEHSPVRQRGDGSNGSKLRMDRQPTTARISDPSLPIGKRKEIDNVMKKARASTNNYWDKKLLEVEEKDPNRWRHTGYKKMYIRGESSSESERDNYRYRVGNNGSNNRLSRSRSRTRKTSPLSPVIRRRSPHSPPELANRRPRSPDVRRRSPRSPVEVVRNRSPDIRRRPRSPPEPPLRRRSRSPVDNRRRSPIPPANYRRRRTPPSVLPSDGKQRSNVILPRSKRPPSPPPKTARVSSNSSVSSCSDDSCSVCSPPPSIHGRQQTNTTKLRTVPRSPVLKHAHRESAHTSTSSKSRPVTEVPTKLSRIQGDEHKIGSKPKHYDKEIVIVDKSHNGTRHREGKELIESRSLSRSQHKVREPEVLEDPRLKARTVNTHTSQAGTTEAQSYTSGKKHKEHKEKKKRETEKLTAKVKIEGEKRKKHESSDSDDSSSSDNSLPTLTATTRLTLSERFGKMAQWSVDRSNMENMRITKDSSGGGVKVMIEEELQSPPRRYSYSPAPAGHFPEELATSAPTGSGLMSWDDVRVRYEYYKSRGYLRDLDLKDYIKWEEWWYRYQEWLKQERYYEFWERQQMNRNRRRKKIPITQRLN